MIGAIMIEAYAISKSERSSRPSFRCRLGATGLAAILMIAMGPAFAEVKTEVGAYGHQGQDPLVPAGELIGPAPLLDHLGALTYKITTKNPEAQLYFDQGLRLSYAFNHQEARRAFQAAERLDPACALCFWGEALVLGPNINAPMDPAANEAALEALARAKAAAQGASGKERDLIEALSTRYSDQPGAERAELDKAYADAMGALSAKYPDDLEIAVLHAEALMDLSPWDYWEAGGTKPKNRTADILATLERVLAENPDHPGAIHLYIHAVEASAAPERAEPYAERLAAQMPGAGHIVHMPSHIYYRVGRYRDALEANKQAVATDERYIGRIKGQSLYTAMYYPHNVHFLMASAQMSGDGPTAIAAADKLAKLISDETARTVVLAQPIKAAPYFAHVQFGTPDSMLALEKPGKGIPYVEAMWHYARAIGFVEKNDLAAAEAEADLIAGLSLTSDFSALEAMAIPSVPVLDLAHEVVLGRIAQKKGEVDGAIGHFERAAALQDGLAYMEPPYWYYPVRQSLGALLLQAGREAEAEAAFRAALKKSPNNGFALFGLAKALAARGDIKAAKEVEARFTKAWAGSSARPDLTKF
jgi:tetratricopeptide (TPR) repeat protein